MCVWSEKTTVLFLCIYKRVKSTVFVVSIKFCDELGLAIKKNPYMYIGDGIAILYITKGYIL